jgi:hypothetical protein
MQLHQQWQNNNCQQHLSVHKRAAGGQATQNKFISRECRFVQAFDAFGVVILAAWWREPALQAVGFHG